MERKDIDAKYKWDLSVIYKDEEAFFADYKKAEDMIADFAKYEKLVNTSAQGLYDTLVAMSDIETLISMLPDDQQRIVMMRYYQDLSFKEIADLEGISINTALGRMRYALINMRKNAQKYNLVRDLEKIFD
jgi:DNA-directed RNA polymerase specialized sigma24 family protein